MKGCNFLICTFCFVVVVVVLVAVVVIVAANFYCISVYLSLRLRVCVFLGIVVSYLVVCMILLAPVGSALYVAAVWPADG